MKPNRAFLFIVSAHLLLIFWGCSKTRPPVDDIPIPPLFVLLDRCESNYAALEDFEAEGILVVKGPEVSSAVGFRMAYLVPDYLKMQFSGSMGVRLGSLVVADGYYELKSSNKAFDDVGELHSLSLLEKFGLPLDGNDIFNLLIPLAFKPLDSTKATLSKDYQKQAFKTVMITDEEEIQTVWFDPYAPVVTCELLQTADFDTIYYRRSGEFRRRSGVYFPYFWNVSIEGDEGMYNIKIKINRLWINRGLKTDLFSIQHDVTADSLEAHHD
ncbi:hypothetical protein CEE37_11020 [candidate division LCP-89 bacterium B3_LCP]|uniref:DUF4292 domain-containing protein n=1 Tax=candidate division LCP-89 bacterium B3_LCP TaxID=2012998 RepID=A0A532UXX5_UNCL8|nr:MAG: hypothetical protein CEE37_11020 [candidate division LCP-89 bacterium B3_LCP]